MSSINEFITQESLRSNVYRRLADVFYQPVAEFSETLRELETSLCNLGSKGHRAAADLQEEFAKVGDMSLLEIDFTQLFSGPFLVLAPPYGCIYLEGKRRTMGDSTVDAQEHYRALGFDLSSDFKDVSDHISVELEFMHILICQEMSAAMHENSDLFLDSLRRQRGFLIKHLGAWVPAFTAKVMAYSTTAFYRHLAAATRQFIKEEMVELSSLDISIEMPKSLHTFSRSILH